MHPDPCLPIQAGRGRGPHPPIVSPDTFLGFVATPRLAPPTLASCGPTLLGSRFLPGRQQEAPPPGHDARGRCCAQAVDLPRPQSPSERLSRSAPAGRSISSCSMQGSRPSAASWLTRLGLNSNISATSAVLNQYGAPGLYRPRATRRPHRDPRRNACASPACVGRPRRSGATRSAHGHRARRSCVSR